MSDFKPMLKQFHQGYWAFRKGILECPYPLHTMRAKEWQRGFDRAYFENLGYKALK